MNEPSKPGRTGAGAAAPLLPTGMVLARPIVLVGLMGSGKTSVGSRLAQALGVAFNDSDAEIERAAALTIAEIFERYGEPHFRDGERRVIARLAEGPVGVIATGGGAFMNDQTRALVQAKTVTIWLKAALDVLVARTAGRGHRPLLNQGDPRAVLADLIETRYPVYAEAHIAVESHAGQAHDSMVYRIVRALKKNGRAFAPAPS